MTKDELTALRQLCAQAQEARADLDNDFPVGAVARGKWQDARRAMADACPRLLAHIEDCHEAVDDFCEIRVHVVLLLAIIRDANISLPPHDAAHVERQARALAILEAECVDLWLPLVQAGEHGSRGVNGRCLAAAESAGQRFSGKVSQIHDHPCLLPAVSGPVTKAIAETSAPTATASFAKTAFA